MKVRLSCAVASGLFSSLAVAANLVFVVALQAEEPPAALYRWQPVRLGAGGFVTGFVTHPLDASVRYCRTDVGNAYRWDGKEWRPMVMRLDGKGMPPDAAATPANGGVDSIAVDPNDKQVVLLAMNEARADMLKPRYPSGGGNIYQSRDGGVTFTAGNLSVSMEPNGPWRNYGERLKVDPNNSAVVLYGSLKEGLWRSLDQGATWRAVRGSGGPASSANVLGVHFVAGGGTVVSEGVKCTRLVFAIGAQGSVLLTEDGGATWKNISAGTALDGKCMFSTIDASGALHVVASGSQDVWSYRDATWRKWRIDLDGPLHALAIDPRNPARIYAVSDGAGLSRSLDGGTTWLRLGFQLAFANSLGWLPQQAGWRSNSGIYFDAAGTLWIPEGNEGPLTFKPTDAEDWQHLPKWLIDSVGIEEFVSHDVILPPHGDAVFAVEDATGFVTSDFSKFVARQIPLQDQLISNGTGLAYCPNAPEFTAIVTADVHYTRSGKSYSGYSADGGKSWIRFAGLPLDPTTGQTLQPAGSIAISRRGNWTTGADHLVWLPTGDGPTFYSHDGGKSWKPSESFPLKRGFWTPTLKQRLLAADPFTPDKFFFVGSWSGGFYVSSDGGKSWQQQPQAGLPIFNHHGQLAVNRVVTDDLWFCDGWDGASQHGLWHSTNGGRTFSRIEGIEYAITLCLGTGPGTKGEAPFSVYFYGKIAASADWGIFRSTDAGTTWRRVSFYPAGIFDQPTCMAASWDEFAKVVVGFNGNGFVVGTNDKELGQDR